MLKTILCSEKDCDNEIDQRRIDLGFTTCLKHGQKAKSYVVIPVPKSNGVVGPIEDLKGISSSHKGTNPSALGGDEWYLTQGKSIRKQFETTKPVEKPLAKGLSNDSCRKLITAKPVAVGYAITGDVEVGQLYATGCVTARTTPVFLTEKGKMIRVMLLQGKVIDISTLKGII